MFCHGPYYCHHKLQSKYNEQCKIHLAVFLISYLNSYRTYLLLGPVPNCGLAYLHLPSWHVNLVKYEDYLSSLRLWYPELASMIIKYHACFDTFNQRFFKFYINRILLKDKLLQITHRSFIKLKGKIVCKYIWHRCSGWCYWCNVHLLILKFFLVLDLKFWGVD